MKSAVITCHDVYNFGASLQAYALAKYLKSIGCDIEIIDYVPKYLFHIFNFLEVDVPKWKRNWVTRWIYRIMAFPTHLSYIKKYVAFKRFNKEYFPLSSKKYLEVSQIESDNYNILICGSDQIWNSITYSCGEDPAYFLSFASKNQKKVAYAASFGSREISEKGEENIKKYLPDFDAVSVREESGVELLRRYGISAENVLDPVFLLSASEWRDIAMCPKEIKNMDYIFIYGYDNSEEFSHAVIDAKKRLNCRVITAQDTVFRNAGPREFLGLIDNAELVVTTSFHAVAFSIILHTPFVTAMTGKETLFERLENIQKLSGLESRRYKLLRKVEHWEEEQIDFDAANAALQTSIETSKNFLKGAIQ